MTIVGLDSAGFAAAETRLDGGEPIVIPTPSPLPYALCGCDPSRINAVKGRAADQPVGATPTSPRALARARLDLDPGNAQLAEWLIFDAHLSVLAPAGHSAPEWLVPATHDGLTALAGAWLDELAPLLSERDGVYGSSANPHGSAPATSAREADGRFDGSLLVLGGDHLRTAGIRHGSSTMLVIPHDGAPSVHRHGIQDVAFDGDDPRFLRQLLEQFAARPTG